MPTLARPDVDSLEGLTTAIILDQERMGANVRSTVGTVTDANALLRVVFSRIGEPHIGGPQAYSFNVPSVSGAGAVKIERGDGPDGEPDVQRRRRDVPALRGHGHRQRHRPDPALRREQVAQRGRHHGPGLHAGRLVDPHVQRSGFFDPDKPIRDYTEKELHDFLYGEPTKVKINGINLTYEGLVPRIQKSYPLQGRRRAAAAHPRVRRARGDVQRVPGVRRHAAQRGGAVIEDRGHQHRRRVRDADQRPGRVGARPRRAVGRAAAGGAPHSLDAFVEIGLGYLSLDRPSGTLSGGEAQRTRMVRHLGSPLTDVTYVFDEPTIGLHAHDVERTNALLQRLRDKGNTVLVVEHDPEVIRIADHVVDMGPGAGPHGGTIVYEGTVEGLVASGTATGRHLDVRAGAEGGRRARRAARSRSATPGSTTSRTSRSTCRSACSWR